MVSMIQSNFYGFGSGIVDPSTGISFNDRGFNFRFDPEHPNGLAGMKRPYHTIIPGFLTQNGEALGLRDYGRLYAASGPRAVRHEYG